MPGDRVMKIDIHKSVEIESTIRTELLSSMFEVPASQKLSVSLTGESEHDKRDYNIGLIVGPSGSGKTILLNSIFGSPRELEWSRRSVIDDFESTHSMEDISRVCQSVGFNTIPSYLRPFSVLSNGERFRAQVARHLLFSGGSNPITIDEFTSVVDRQVAQFACYSIQKYVRERGRKLVVASCHYDIIPWLQPDWILEPGNPCRFTWRSLQGRPRIECKVQRVKYEAWQLFRDFHYMSQELNKAARCYGLYVSTTGVEIKCNNEYFHPRELWSRNNDGVSTGSRIPSGLSMHGRSVDSRMVLHEDDWIESECSDAESGNSVEAGSFRSADHSSGKGSSTGQSEALSVDELPTEEARYSSRSTPATEHESSESNAELLFPIQSVEDVGQGRHDVNSPDSYRITSLCGVLYRPHPKVRDIMGFTRMVTLPDYQGLGLAFVLANTVASAYKALGFRLHSYPNHPAWIRSYQRSKNWMQVKEAGVFSPKRGSSSTVGGFGGRRCAVFQFIGDAMNKEDAERLVNAEA